MNFGFVLSLLTVIVAVLSVFIEIPIVSNYAFWFAVGAYVMLAGTKAKFAAADRICQITTERRNPGPSPHVALRSLLGKRRGG